MDNKYSRLIAQLRSAKSSSHITEVVIDNLNPAVKRNVIHFLESINRVHQAASIGTLDSSAVISIEVTSDLSKELVCDEIVSYIQSLGEKDVSVTCSTRCESSQGCSCSIEDTEYDLVNSEDIENVKQKFDKGEISEFELILSDPDHCRSLIRMHESLNNTNVINLTSSRMKENGKLTNTEPGNNKPVKKCNFKNASIQTRRKRKLLSRFIKHVSRLKKLHYQNVREVCKKNWNNVKNYINSLKVYSDSFSSYRYVDLPLRSAKQSKFETKDTIPKTVVNLSCQEKSMYHPYPFSQFSVMEVYTQTSNLDKIVYDRSLSCKRLSLNAYWKSPISSRHPEPSIEKLQTLRTNISARNTVFYKNGVNQISSNIREKPESVLYNVKNINGSLKSFSDHASPFDCSCSSTDCSPSIDSKEFTNVANPFFTSYQTCSNIIVPQQPMFYVVPLNQFEDLRKRLLKNHKSDEKRKCLVSSCSFQSTECCSESVLGSETQSTKERVTISMKKDKFGRNRNCQSKTKSVKKIKHVYRRKSRQNNIELDTARCFVNRESQCCSDEPSKKTEKSAINPIELKYEMYPLRDFNFENSILRHHLDEINEKINTLKNQAIDRVAIEPTKESLEVRTVDKGVTCKQLVDIAIECVQTVDASSEYDRSNILLDNNTQTKPTEYFELSDSHGEEQTQPNRSMAHCFETNNNEVNIYGHGDVERATENSEMGRNSILKKKTVFDNINEPPEKPYEELKHYIVPSHQFYGTESNMLNTAFPCDNVHRYRGRNSKYQTNNSFSLLENIEKKSSNSCNLLNNILKGVKRSHKKELAKQEQEIQELKKLASDITREINEDLANDSTDGDSDEEDIEFWLIRPNDSTKYRT